ncbi:N-glycosylase/DNA lyase [Candidatus Tiddalikarchaeum anstoanum]|nr:N-glycosylase/DNA lyase [Candidatus Tiddalikarchaeum anstoanum]
MNKLVSDINDLKRTVIKKTVDTRLKEFEELGKKNNDDWFSELCFCILTANSKARTALAIQKELGPKGFCNLNREDISKCIQRNKHRFHNNKSRFIIEARQFKNIKTILSQFKDEFMMREWLVKNVKGLGYKEASHFLRNVGFKNVSILDRHILNLLYENNYITKVPKPLTKKNYFEIEKIFQKLAKEMNMSCAELDLYMWYMKAGEVLK